MTDVIESKRLFDELNATNDKGELVENDVIGSDFAILDKDDQQTEVADNESTRDESNSTATLEGVLPSRDERARENGTLEKEAIAAIN